MAPAEGYWGRTALYRLFDSEGVLLYVGIANEPEARWGQHGREKHWWPQVDQKLVEWFPERTDATAAEAAAIRDERPLYNQTHSVVAAPVRRHGDAGRVVASEGVKVSVESFTMTSAIANLSWATRAASNARWELGELPITYLTRHGVATLAIVPTWLAEWVEKNASVVLELIESGAAPKVG